MREDRWSVPESTVLSELRGLRESGERGVLATVVGVEGSAYRRPGAKMLLPSDGGGFGSITAGCLEDDVRRIASDVLEDGHPRIETFDLTGDSDDDVWGLGVGCNGVIDLLLEPVDEGYDPILDAYESGESVVNFTVLESAGPAVETWQRAWYRRGDGVVSTSDAVPDWFSDALVGPADRLLEEEKSERIEIPRSDGRTVVFADSITPPSTLVAVGTGHDVNPVVELANRNDFQTVVVGYRGVNATEERFPLADTVVSTSPVDIDDVVDLDENTYVVVMSHNFIDDRLTLDELVQSPVEYVGLMGPRERFEEMLEDFAEEGRQFSEEELENVYTPVGLDLGGGTPYQIAHSIVSEVLAVRNDRDPKHLKEREGPIHDRESVQIE